MEIKKTQPRWGFFDNDLKFEGFEKLMDMAIQKELQKNPPKKYADKDMYHPYYTSKEIDSFWSKKAGKY